MATPKLARIPSMRERVQDTLSAHRNELVSLHSRYVAQRKAILQPHHLVDELDKVISDDKGKQILSDGPFNQVLKSAQDFHTRKKIGGGREFGGLYYLDESVL